MAEENPLQSLQEEATCPLCLEYFKEPLTTQCGHNFCHSCVARCWKGPDDGFPCPECREPCTPSSLKPNRQLRSVVRITQQLSLQHAAKATNGLVCEKHDEKLKLYCKDDQKCICVVCGVSSCHRSHAVIPIEEAAQEFKVKYRSWLEPLNKEMADLLEQKSKEELKFEGLKSDLEAMRQKVLTETKYLRKLLADCEYKLLRQLENIDQRIRTAENAKMAALSDLISSFGNLVQEIEEQCKQAAGDFMKDVKITLSKCENMKFQKLEEKIKYYKVNVVLDPQTAHCDLILAEDGRTVIYGKTPYNVPDHPKRFDFFPCVLGRDGFTSGRTYWEVEVRGYGGWYVGAVRESVKRKGAVNMLPEEGVWAIWGFESEIKALTFPLTILSLKDNPSRLGVYLDYEGRRLSLYNADTLEHLYTYKHTFAEKIYPFFWVTAKVQLCLV